MDRKLFWGALFSFPWQGLSEQLEKTFKLPIKLIPSELEWQEKKDVYSGVPSPYVPIAITLPGIQGQILIVIARSELEIFMGTLLNVQVPTLQQQEETFFDQFCRFFAVTLVSCSHGVNELAPLSPKLDNPQDILGTGALVQNIEIHFQDQKISARVILPQLFLESWKKAHPTQQQQARSDLLEQFSIQLNLEAGRTYVQADELTSLQAGDFLLIDHPFYIPGSTRARTYLTHKGNPLFRAKIKNGALKILEMPLQHEAFTPLGGLSMTTQEPLPQENIEHLDETEGFEEDEELESTEGTQEEESQGEESQRENQQEELESSEEESPEKEPEESEQEAPEEEEHTEIPEEEIKTTQKTHLSREPLKVEEIPLTVVVQFAELNMTLQQLSSLHPGNLLDLNIRPEDGVVLVVNDRVCAEGELVMIGDKVGVRIKEVGFEATQTKDSP